MSWNLKTDPALLAALKDAAGRKMTPDEEQKQRASYIRSVVPYAHGECPSAPVADDGPKPGYACRSRCCTCKLPAPRCC